MDRGSRSCAGVGKRRDSRHGARPVRPRGVLQRAPGDHAGGRTPTRVDPRGCIRTRRRGAERPPHRPHRLGSRRGWIRPRSSTEAAVSGNNSTSDRIHHYRAGRGHSHQHRRRVEPQQRRAGECGQLAVGDRNHPDGDPDRGGGRNWRGHGGSTGRTAASRSVAVCRCWYRYRVCRLGIAGGNGERQPRFAFHRVEPSAAPCRRECRPRVHLRCDCFLDPRSIPRRFGRPHAVHGDGSR